MVHEWALAEAIIKTLKQHIPNSCGRKISYVEIVVGSLQAIDIDILKFAVNELARNRQMKIAKINYVSEDAKFKCRRCGNTWSLSEMSLSDEDKELIHFIPEAVYAIVSCGKCGSRDFDIISGRGVYISRIEV